MSKVDQAIERFKNGANCAQAVACTYADELGVDESTLEQVTAGFGAGINGLGGTCGALAGAIALVGFKAYQNLEVVSPTREIAYPLCDRIQNAFVLKQGYSTCHEILAHNTDEVIDNKKTCCVRAVSNACHIIEEYLLEKGEENGN